MTFQPDKATFLERAKQGNLVPVWRELLTDEQTPVSAYARLRAALREERPDTPSFLLESVEGGEKIARYSFLGGDPQLIFRATGRRVELERAGGKVEVREDVDPLAELRALLEVYRPVQDPALPRFFGGAVGYIGYDAIPQFEPRVGLAKTNDLGWPELLFVLTDTLLIFDHVRHAAKVVANVLIEGDAEAAYEEAVGRINRMCDALARPVEHQVIDLNDPVEPLECRSNMTREQFETNVEKAKEYIRAGDIVQVVLSQRFEADVDGDPLDVYRALRCVNPSPYMYCLEFGGRSVVGSSPEIHVRLEEGKVELRPIAGTRPRAHDPEEDDRLEQELLADPKERAEHIMLVDLARNDLGRVCRYGSVKVPELMVIERYSHVMHIVSDVVGEIEGTLDAADLMRATFPAGTVSGAPKIRAMEIIAELEETRRGPYAGAVGYFGFGGNLDSCITIRTVLLEKGKAYVQAGAGIVADSSPAAEFEETRNKARGMMRALALSRNVTKARRKMSQ
ncbi:MAG TPA: anthranilate synthase component I [Kiritimatiellia bacterium]|nr:anthranilate synthase component I [Kiritimatiellia bacterium]